MNQTQDKKGFFAHFKGDFWGGITAGVVALPLALAFGVSSGLGPDAGLYGAIFLAFFAALFGGTPTQISGPTAPMTAVSMLIIAGIIQTNNGDVQAALPAILTVFLLAGVMQIVLGVSGVGQYIKFIPYPVVSGFMTAIGVIIIITQLLPALGYYATEDLNLVDKFTPQAEEVILKKFLSDEAGEGILVIENLKETVRRAENTTPDAINAEARTLAGNYASGVVGSIKALPRALSNIKWIELILALITIVIVFGFKRITKALPSTLVALVLVSGVAYALQYNGIINYRPIPEIPSGLPLPRMEIFTEFSFGAVLPYVFTAATLAMLGVIDSLLTSVVADNMTKTKHNPDKELVGQGIGNTIAAIFGGLPGAGATIRTVVNINAGGKTKLSGMIAGVLLLFILLALGPIASLIPAGVLAGILITVGIGVMDYKGLKSLPSMTKPERVVLFTVLILSVVWNLVYAVGVGLVIAALVFMKKMSDVASEKSKVEALNNDGDERWNDEVGFPDSLSEEVFIKHLDGPLFFGYTSGFLALSKQIPDTASHVIIRMDKVPYVDQSGLFAMEDVIQNLDSRDITTLLVNVQSQPMIRLNSLGIVPDLIEEKFVFDNMVDCINYINTNVSDIYKPS